MPINRPFQRQRDFYSDELCEDFAVDAGAWAPQATCLPWIGLEIAFVTWQTDVTAVNANVLVSARLCACEDAK